LLEERASAGKTSSTICGILCRATRRLICSKTYPTESRQRVQRTQLPSRRSGRKDARLIRPQIRTTIIHRLLCAAVMAAMKANVCEPSRIAGSVSEREFLRDFQPVPECVKRDKAKQHHQQSVHNRYTKPKPFYALYTVQEIFHAKPLSRKIYIQTRINSGNFCKTDILTVRVDGCQFHQSAFACDFGTRYLLNTCSAFFWLAGKGPPLLGSVAASLFWAAPDVAANSNVSAAASE